MNRYQVTRIVQEEYAVEAANEAEAIEIISERGDPFSSTVVKETVRLIPPVDNTKYNNPK